MEYINQVICPACGVKQSVTAKSPQLFCTHCGSRLNSVSPMVQSFCTRCGARISQNLSKPNSFCTNCGARLTSRSEAPIEIPKFYTNQGKCTEPAGVFVVPPEEITRNGKKSTGDRGILFVVGGLLVLSCIFLFLSDLLPADNSLQTDGSVSIDNEEVIEKGAEDNNIAEEDDSRFDIMVDELRKGLEEKYPDSMELLVDGHNITMNYWTDSLTKALLQSEAMNDEDVKTQYNRLKDVGKDETLFAYYVVALCGYKESIITFNCLDPIDHEILLSFQNGWVVYEYYEESFSLF